MVTAHTSYSHRCAEISTHVAGYNVQSLRYDGRRWLLTLGQKQNTMQVTITFCPFCGIDLEAAREKLSSECKLA